MRVVLINTYEGLADRVAVVENGELTGFYFNRHAEAGRNAEEGSGSLSQFGTWGPGYEGGRICLGKVAGNAEALGGVFVDLPGGKRGILERSGILASAVPRPGLRPFAESKKACCPVKEFPKAGTLLLVQIKREASGNKLARLTTDVELPGRLLVLRPYRPVRRISRSVTDKARREELHRILKSLELPGLAGLILRSEGAGVPAGALQVELRSLVKRWESIVDSARRCGEPCLLYTGGSFLERIARDEIRGEGTGVFADNRQAFSRLEELLSVLEGGDKVKLRFYEGEAPIFSAFSVEREVQKLYNKRLSLPGGGNLVLQYTEALISADVNSGPRNGNQEDIAYQTNLEAARELFRQLRLRGAGGLVVCDFIGMRDTARREALEKLVYKLAREDPAKVRFYGLDRLGFGAFTRESRTSGISHLNVRSCPVCEGTGWTPGEFLCAVRFLDELRRRAESGKVKAGVSGNVLAILAHSKDFQEITEKLGDRLVLEKLEKAEERGFEIR